jgi:hypothetical protein
VYAYQYDLCTIDYNIQILRVSNTPTNTEELYTQERDKTLKSFQKLSVKTQNYLIYLHAQEKTCRCIEKAKKLATEDFCFVYPKYNSLKVDEIEIEDLPPLIEEDFPDLPSLVDASESENEIESDEEYSHYESDMPTAS